MTKKTHRLLQGKATVGIIGARIRAFRIANNLQQKELGELVGLNQATISEWERGGESSNRTKEQFEKLMELIKIDETPREELPHVQAPVPTTTGLRVALSTPEDEFAYSPRKIRHSLDYLKQNVEHLLERYERTIREIQHLEQTQGITQEQLAVLRDKARRYDEIREKLK